MPPKYIGPSARLELGKYRVNRVFRSGKGQIFSITIDEVTLAINAPPYADIREGDLITLFTEVAINANPKPTPKQ